MLKKKKTLLLKQISKDSGELESMMADLCGESAPPSEGNPTKHWSRPFAAIGKCELAPRVRLE
jgi:hypothetical protein